MRQLLFKNCTPRSNKLFLFQAVSVATAIQDRICIHSDGKLQPQISARNLLSCEKLSAGCNGGFSINAWLYWKQYGLVSGGPYGSNVVSNPE